MNAKKTLLSMALAAAVLAAAPALAQDAPPPDSPDAVDDGSAPKDRLVGEYVDDLFNGDEAAAAGAVTSLRTGGDFTLVASETRQATNPDGTLATNPDGTPKMETVTVETAVENPNGPMGWGEVDHSLGLAQALVEKGEAGSVGDALMGEAITTTVTHPDGTTATTTTYEGGILQLRADGMGWGQIAKELGFRSLGDIKSGRAFAESDTGVEEGASTASADAAVKGKGAGHADNRGKSGEHKTDRAAKADRVTGKPDKLDRVAKVDRPEKIDRPQRPERPERPSKPERVGRP